MGFEVSSRIVSGNEELKNIGIHLKALGYKNPALLCDKNLYDSSEYVMSCIESIRLEYDLLFFLYDYPFEPSYQFIDKLNERVIQTPKSSSIDCWIAIGGGSAMDSAKVLAILASNPGSAMTYKGFPEDLNKPLPIICVPSTTGTGSEVVYNASLIDEVTKVKMGVNYKKNYPVLAILDPNVVASAPLSVLSSSGCDAMVHSLESFVSPLKTHESKMFSVMAFKMILNNMPIILSSEGNLDNWLSMQWASIFAMHGLSNSSSGPAGALSYYLGTNYKVNHGVAGAVFIGKISRFNHENGLFDYSELYEGRENNLSEEEKSLAVINSIEELLALANIPNSLTHFGVTAADLEGFCDFRKQTDGAFKMNPIHIDEQALIERILK